MRSLLFTALLFVSTPMLADSHGQPNTGPIAETFTCTFNDGKDADDLWAAAEYFNAQVDKIGSKDLNDYFAAVLMPFRATIAGDYGWIGYWPSLNAMASGLSAYYGGKEGQSADERFANVAACKSNTWLRTPLLTNFPDDNATPQADAVELHGCTLRQGFTMADAAAAEQGFLSVNSDKPIAVDRWTPLLANTPLDLVYLVAHEDIGKFASFNSEWLTSSPGQTNRSRFNEVMNCESGLYTGRVIRQGSAE